MFENLTVENVDFATDDGRWDDDAFLTEQAELSAAQDAYENRQEIG